MKIHPLLTRPRATSLLVAMALTFGPGGLLPFAVAQAAPAPKREKQAATVTLNFVNAEIEGVARAMSAIMNRQILVDPRVKGAITLYSDQPLTPREAYLNFMAALRGQGFSLVEVAGMLKIVPEAEAKLQTGTVDVGSVSRSGDQVLTQIFRVQYENANNLVTVLRPLISPNNTINANASTNSLIITDYADNLKRIAQMIAALDVPIATDMEVIPLQYAIASDLGPVVQRLADGGGSPTPGGGGAGQATLIMADPRTNSLMVRAPNVARLNLVRNVIQRLDRPGNSGLGGSGIHVVYLKNADAVKLAQVLRAAFPGAGGAGGSGGASGGGSSAPSGMPTSITSATASSLQSGGGSNGASQQSTAPVSASQGPSTGGFIQADPSTNSLIITATDAMYRQLRSVIDQLDGRRAQIFIESLIVKVDADKTSEIGVQWAAATGNNNIFGVGTNLPLSNVLGLASVITAAGDTVPRGISIGAARKTGDGRYSLGALATFLEGKAGVNIVSKPNMVALDNEEAKIVVGENVPFVTGSFTNTGASSGSVNPFQTVERKDVGLTLRVRPQVGEGGTVRMTVYQEDSSVKPTAEASTNGPTTSKSSIETTVVVDDGQTLVLGGLLKESDEENASQVPLLGDIPVIGHLFKSTRRAKTKTNLMVFLRPVVLRNQEDSNRLTLDRYEFMRGAQEGLVGQQKQPMSFGEGPVLDPLKLSNKLTMPSVTQPLDEPGAPAPTVVMPADSGYAPKLAPQPAVPAGQAPAGQ